MDRQNRYGVKKQVFLVVPAVLVVLLLLFLGMVGGRMEAGSAAAPSLANTAITPTLPTSYITVTPNCGCCRWSAYDHGRFQFPRFQSDLHSALRRRCGGFFAPRLQRW